MKSLRVAFAALLVIPALFAARSSAPSPSAMRTQDPHDAAMMSYESGERRLDKIAKMHDELKSETDAKKTEKLKNNISKQLENAAADFKRAIQNDPNLYQAHSELGFALRKLGKYEDSLAAYDRALQIQPGFAPAIEYRAEAYLGLNRIDEARQSYMALFNGDRARADLLLEAMKQWVAAKKTDPSGVDTQQIEQFGKWIEQRDVIHKQTTSLSTKSADIRSW